ncbi:MAG TPA: DUF3352 domain-containing protein [Gemmataceae bacterium]|nr:DUF3352 domain-containing protein [Gemmataceae bacterium]
MRIRCMLAVWLMGLALATPAAAETPDLLRLVPAQADLLVKVEQPRRLVESVLNHPLIKDLYQIDAIRDLYSSTNARRFDQLIAYFEKRLGVDRLEMIDHLAGGGTAVAVRFERLNNKKSPVLLAVQAKDEPMLHRFFQVGLEIIEQELARQEAKDHLAKRTYRDIEIVDIGEEFHAAVVGSALLIGNVAEAVERGIDQHLGGGKNSLAGMDSVADARKLANPDPLVWMWLNLETARKGPPLKDLLAGGNPVLTAVAGPVLDIVRRSPFLCATVQAQEHGVVLSFRMPRGRDEMPAELAGLLPAPGEPGSRPLLKPQGVLYSTSYFLDLAKLWDNRAKLLNEEQLKALDAFEVKSGRFLAGTRLNTLLNAVGPYQRVVVAHQAKTGYKTPPGQYVPAFAFVLEMREPDLFSKRAETILRGAALLATTQLPFRSMEEKHGAHRIVAYRFSEDAKVKGDTNNIRFNFSPCFVSVGNQFVISSNLELCHELIDLLEKEAAHPESAGPSPPLQTQIFAVGGTALLDTFKDRLFTQTILDQAIPPERAKQQVQAFTDWVRRLGSLRLETDYGREDFRYDIRLKTAD